MKSLAKCSLFTAICLAGSPLAAHASGLTQQEFESWVHARCGSGQPVYWYLEGSVHAYPGSESRGEVGNMLFRFGFVEENRLVTDPDQPGTYICLGRKINFFRDKDTGELLHKFRGHEVKQLVYPYQMLAITLKDGKINVVATQGAGKHLRSYQFSDVAKLVEFGGYRTFTSAASFYAKVGDRNTYEALSYVLPPGSIGKKDPSPGFVLTMQYDRPAWADGNGKNYMISHGVGGRSNSYDEWPAYVREFVEKEAPEFRAPPVDLGEIKHLQQ